MSADDLAAIHQLSRGGDHIVIAVAFDIGDGRLRELHGQARLAGAERCHVIDIREEFARGYLLPAIQRGTPISEVAIGALAAACVTRKLQQIAELEGDAEVNAPSFIPITGVAAVRSVGIDRGADVEIAFESGTPVAMSRIPMSVFELIDCLNTIGVAHGVSDAWPGVRLLQCGYQALNPGGAASSGVVRLEVNQGRMVAARTDYATT